MAGIRIRWRGVARVVAIVFVALIVLRLLPEFLRAPEPPPLGADVGLPQSAPVPDEPRPRSLRPADTRKRRASDRPAARPRKHRQRRRPDPVADAPAAKAVIGSRHRKRVKVETKATPPPAPEYTPPPAPQPVAEPLPEPPPAPRSTPDDGSQEFAPH